MRDKFCWTILALEYFRFVSPWLESSLFLLDLNQALNCSGAGLFVGWVFFLDLELKSL